MRNDATYLDVVRWMAGNEDLRIAFPFPFCLPIPSLFRTSLTSPGRGFILFWPRERTGVSFENPYCVSACDGPPEAEPWSSVEMDGTRALAAAAVRFGFDMLLRPSSASRRSRTRRSSAGSDSWLVSVMAPTVGGAYVESCGRRGGEGRGREGECWSVSVWWKRAGYCRVPFAPLACDDINYYNNYNIA